MKDKKKQERETFHRMRQHFLEDYGDNDEERIRQAQRVFEGYIEQEP